MKDVPVKVNLNSIQHNPNQLMIVAPGGDPGSSQASIVTPGANHGSGFISLLPNEDPKKWVPVSEVCACMQSAKEEIKILDIQKLLQPLQNP